MNLISMEFYNAIYVALILGDYVPGHMKFIIHFNFILKYIILFDLEDLFYMVTNDFIIFENH